jgi:hypothetical protein
VWRVGDAEPRLISPTPSAQWHPWIDRDRVAWIDQRHGNGDRVDPDNPEVYYSDLNTGEVRRITNDPPSRPAVQDAVTIEGDWIAWMDPGRRHLKFNEAVQRREVVAELRDDERSRRVGRSGAWAVGGVLAD